MADIVRRITHQNPILPGLYRDYKDGADRLLRRTVRAILTTSLIAAWTNFPVDLWSRVADYMLPRFDSPAWARYVVPAPFPRPVTRMQAYIERTIEAYIWMARFDWESYHDLMHASFDLVPSYKYAAVCALHELFPRDDVCGIDWPPMGVPNVALARRIMRLNQAQRLMWEAVMERSGHSIWLWPST